MEINMSASETVKMPSGNWNWILDPEHPLDEITVKDLFGNVVARILIDENGNATVHPPVRCEDCGRKYGDEYGFPDLVVPLDIWEQMMPGRGGGGLLCPSCMCERAYHLDIVCKAVFRSGPFRFTYVSDMGNCDIHTPTDDSLMTAVEVREELLKDIDKDEPIDRDDVDRR